MSTQTGMSERLFNCEKKKNPKSPLAGRNPRIIQCWHDAESDFTHILSECVVNTGSPEFSPLLNTCLSHTLFLFLPQSNSSFPCILFSIFFCCQERAWSAGRACTERTTPARRWTACITHAASPVCPAVRRHKRTQSDVLAQSSDSGHGNE